MRAIGYLLYDPQAPPGSPHNKVRLEGALRRYCTKGRHTLEYTVAFPLGGPETRDSLGALSGYVERHGGPCLVVVAEPRHLGATPEEAVDALLKLDGLGARVACLEEDRRNPLRELYEAMAPSGEGQGSARARNIRVAMQAKAVRGEGLGKPPYGYQIGGSGKLEEVVVEADVVRLIFQLYLEGGLGLRNIVRELNTQGHRTRRGGNWSVVTVRDILRNASYVGTYRRFGFHIPRSHQPLVESGVFRKVQDLMASRSPLRRRSMPEPFLLSRLAVCSQCGNYMIGVTRRQVWRNKDRQRMRGVYRYYQCQSRTNQGVCGYHTWRAAALEEAVLEEVRRQIREKPELIGHTPPAVKVEPPEEGRGVGYRERYIACLKQAAEGAIPLGRLRELLAGLKAEAVAVAAETQDTPGEESPLRGGMLLEVSRWQGLNEAQRRQALERWVERIDVDDSAIYVKLRVG